MKVVINSQHGGYSLSPQALLWLWEHGAGDKIATPVNKYFTKGDDDSYFGKKKALADWHAYQQDNAKSTLFLTPFSPDESYVFHTHPDDDKLPRNDPKLIECIETLTPAVASGALASLAIVEIPDDVDFIIEEYDGLEWIAERHRTWG